MAATMDHQQRHLGGVGFDHLPYPISSNSLSGPSWPASTTAIFNQMYPSALGPNTSSFEALVKHQAARSNNISLPFTSIPASTSTIGAPSAYGPYGNQDLLNLPPSFSNIPRTYEHGYSAAAVSSEDAYSSLPAPYLSTYGSNPQQQQTQQQPQQQSQQQSQQPQQQQQQQQHQQQQQEQQLQLQQHQQQQQSHSRRSSLQSTSSTAQSQSSYEESLEGRVLDEMGEDLTTPRVDLTTPRNIYGQKNNRESADSYGFPQSHSSHSSISSASAFPSYYSSSLDNSSVSDYGSQSDSLEPINSRTLPPPTGLINASVAPAPPSSMMGQFNSKISSSTQKKHKCKICDKRFTRPSSLQTHMYSHTGEKPYACEAEGCGRHFSVVSNLRRHRKVHRCDQSPDKDSPEGSWVSETSLSNH